MANDIQDYVDDNPFRENNSSPTPQYPPMGPRGDGYQEEQGAFGDIDPVLIQFNLLLSKWIEGLDSDDMDRVDRQAAANRWLTEYQRYRDGVIGPEELRAFEPDGLEDMPGWNEYFETVLEPSEGAVTEQDLIGEWGEEKVAEYKEKLDAILDKTKSVLDDPWGAVGDLISSTSTTGGPCWKGVYTGPDWVRNCVSVGLIFGIPGLPVPPIPGILDVTVGEIEDALKKVGRTIEDIATGAEKCGGTPATDTSPAVEGTDECTWAGAIEDLGKWIVDKAKEAIPDLSDPEDIGGWVGGILGDVLGGVVLGEVGDTLGGIIFGDGSGGGSGEGSGDGDKDDDSTKLPPGAEEEEEDEAETEDEAEVDPEEEVDPNTSSVASDTTDDDDPGLSGGDDTVDDDPATGGPDCSQPRPEGPYTFATQAWDRVCGGSGGGTAAPSADECPPGYTWDTNVDECIKDQELSGSEEEEESSEEGGGGSSGGGGSGNYKGGVLGLDYETPVPMGLLGSTGVDSVAALNDFIARQVKKRKPPRGSGGMLT